MDLENKNGFTLRGLEQINVVLGKNGCGKSYLFKQVEQALTNDEGIGKVRYLSPERGGQLSYEAGVEHQMANSPQWLSSQRRQNQSGNFRQQSVTLFRRLELLYHRQNEKHIRRMGEGHHQERELLQVFDVIVDQINTLLDRVQIERHDQLAFSIVERENGNPVNPGDISSGESELISLGIEFLAFVQEAEAGKENYLFADEPDVHLHPDLQDRLTKFIVDVLDEKPVRLILATHSTSILAGFSDKVDTTVSFMRRGDQEISFKSVTEVDRTILPIFGAHPLSNVFNKAPVLLIDGEDDERVWQQAVRSSDGRISVYPCAVDGAARFTEFETEVRNVIEAVYDNAVGYSLRDRDLDPEEIDDYGPIIRMRLSCREVENLMLSNDALNIAETDWATFQEKIQTWIGGNSKHQFFAEVQAFAEGGFSRKDHDIKPIRNILIGLVTNKPWEVLVGQAIAGLTINGGADGVGSLRDFLGEKVCESLLKLD